MIDYYFGLEGLKFDKKHSTTLLRKLLKVYFDPKNINLLLSFITLTPFLIY